MRKVHLAVATAIAILAAGAIGSTRSEAMTPADLGPAIDEASPVEQTACWRYGWRGWGWYRWCGHRRYYGPYYGYYRPYYRPYRYRYYRYY